MAPNREAPTTTRPYGRACTTCAKAKCRCIIKPGAASCERCHRLNYLCVPGDSTRQRNAQRNNPISRIAQLEGKLDTLVSMLGAGGQISATKGTSNSRVGAISPPLSTHSTSASGPSDTAATATSSPTCPPILKDVSSEEAVSCLSRFKGSMLKFLPFLHLSDEQHLRRERPFLLLSIVAVATPSTKRKLVLFDRIKQALAERMFVDTDQCGITLDLLLGLLVFLAWGYDHLLRWLPCCQSRYAQLAMMIVFDMRLNKPPPTTEDTNMLPVDHFAGKCLKGKTSTGSLEERRAVLATFLLSSIFSSYFSKIDPMQWTPYMEECAQMLSESDECPSDRKFACQVRLQLVAGDAENFKGTSDVPLEFYVEALRRKVDDIKSITPPRLLQDETLQVCIKYAELGIYSLALANNHPGFQNIDSLYACLNTVKSSFDAFFKLQGSEYGNVSFTMFASVARFLVVLYKLSTLGDATWDKKLVRSTVDLFEIMDQIIRNLEQVKAAQEEESADGLVDRAVKIFQGVRVFFSTKATDNEDIGMSGEVGFQVPTESNMLLETDEWFREYFASGFMNDHTFP